MSVFYDNSLAGNGTSDTFFIVAKESTLRGADNGFFVTKDFGVGEHLTGMLGHVNDRGFADLAGALGHVRLKLTLASRLAWSFFGREAAENF